MVLNFFLIAIFFSSPSSALNAALLLKNYHLIRKLQKKLNLNFLCVSCLNFFKCKDLDSAPTKQHQPKSQ